jgi:hypothetical protein
MLLAVKRGQPRNARDAGIGAAHVSLLTKRRASRYAREFAALAPKARALTHFNN